jgi:hypothetical protein
MAGPLLTTLGRNAALFLPVAQGAVSRGLPAQAAINAFRASGGSIRRQTALEVFRAVAGLERRASAILSVRKDRRPSVASLPPALTKIRRGFSFTAEIRGTVAETGASLTRFITISTDEIPTIGEMEALAEEIASGSGEGYGIEVDQVRITRGIAAGPGGVF